MATATVALVGWQLKEMIMNIKTLENSLFWQQVVLKQSTDPEQIKRVKQRVAYLQQQIANISCNIT